MPLYPARALERAMKIREVITRAMSGKINWLQAAEIIGITDRSMRRWRERLEVKGYEGLFDRRTRRPSARRIDMTTVEAMLKLYREIERRRNVDALSVDARLIRTAQGNLISPEREAACIRLAIEEVAIMLADEELCVVDLIW